MAKASQVNIRFEDGDDAELERTAQRLGMSKSALVRHLTRQFLDEVRRTGSLQINPTWIKALGAADARSAWGERKLKVAEDEVPLPPTTMKSVTYPKGKKR